MALIFVDCEAHGPCPGLGWLREFGAVEFKTRETFYGILTEHSCFYEWTSPLSRGYPRYKHEIFLAFKTWLSRFRSQPVFVSDNPAFDWQWINYEFHHLLGDNPFGHSARRISDFYAGLKKDFRKTQEWKRWRVTKHDHHPVHDAIGNVEAFERMLREMGAKVSAKDDLKLE